MQNLRSVQPIVEEVFHLDEGVSLIPFCRLDGSPHFSDIHLAQVFRRIVREETVSRVFYDGSIVNTSDFIRFFKNHDREIFFVEHNGREVGFFWLEKFRHKTSFINYCFYREYWGENALHISRVSIDFLFERKDCHGEFLIDMLLGLTPSTNKLAIKFLLKNGMTVLGKMPKMLFDVKKGTNVDGVFSYKQRSKNGKIKFPTFLMIH